MTVVTRLYDTYTHAQTVVRDLKAIGISESDISVFANPKGEGYEEETSNTATGASLGAAVGGGAGLLTGLGMMAIPGVGPVVAAGWLAATLAGAVAGAASGGIIGALTEIGHSREDSEIYAEGLRRGGTLVTVRTVPPRETEVELVMDRSQPVDTGTRRAEYSRAGWTGFDVRP
jgi:hypothetical protein